MTGVNETLRVWDTTTGALVQTLKGNIEESLYSATISSIAFSSDGKQVVAGLCSGALQLWDVNTGKLLHTLKSVTPITPPSDSDSSSNGIETSSVDSSSSYDDGYDKEFSDILSVAFSSDGKLVVAGSDNFTVTLWDTNAGILLHTLRGHSQPVTSVAFLPDSKQIVSRSNDRKVRLWDTTTGALLEKLEGHTNSAALAASSFDKKLQPSILVSSPWVVESNANLLWLPFGYRHTHIVSCNGSLVLAHSSGRISFFQFTQGPKLIT